MGYLIVVALSLLVGASVYAVTMRSAGRERLALGFGDSGSDERESGADGPGPGFAYLRVATSGPSWRERIQGFVGLIVLLAAATAALAFGTYQLGHLINQTIERFLDK